MILLFGAAQRPAFAGIGDAVLPQFSDGKPSVSILKVPGIVKRTRLQTDFLCTSFETSAVDIGVQLFDTDGTLLNDVHAGAGAILNVASGQTVTIGTKATAAFLESLTITAADISQGSARVVASASGVRCNVLLVDDGVTPPVSLATLGEGVRPIAGAVLTSSALPQFADGKAATHAAVIPGVVKRGSVEMDFLCTSLAPDVIDVGVEIFSSAGVLLNSVTAGNGAVLNLAPGATVTFGTTGTAALLESHVLTVAAVSQGLARIVSTSDQVACTALVIDAGVAPPGSLSALNVSGSAPATLPGLPAALPVFSDGKPSVLVMTVPGVAKRTRLDTEFLCTSFDSTPIDIGVEITNLDGTRVNDISVDVGTVLNVGPGQTVTIGTAATATYLESTTIPVSTGMQGVARIIGSSANVRCNVELLDPSVSPPVSLATIDGGVRPLAGAVPATLALPQFSNGHVATHAAVVPGVVKRANMEMDFFCTSLASSAIDVGVQMFSPNATLLNDVHADNGAVVNVQPGATVTLGTTGTAEVFETEVISMSGVAQGFARIVSNSGEVVCNTLMLDAALTPPTSMSALVGFTLQGSGGGTPTATTTPSPSVTLTATATNSATATPSQTQTSTRTPTPTPGVATLTLAAVAARPGGSTCLRASLVTSGNSVGSTQNDWTFDAGLFGVLTCAVNPAIGPGSAIQAPLSRQSPSSGIERFSVGPAQLGTSLPDGLLYSCQVAVSAATTMTTYPTTSPATATDSGGMPLQINGVGAQLKVTTCTGDCDANNVVSIGEVVRCINAFLGAGLCSPTHPESSCPVADANLDGTVSLGEVSACTSRFLGGCV